MMKTKTWLTSIFILFLFAGTAFAQPSGDAPSDAEKECAQERDEAYRDADEDHAEEQEDRPSDRPGDAEDASRADQERDEAYREADEEYEECLADARDDARDDEDRGRGSDDDEGSRPVPASYTGRHVSFGVTPDGIVGYAVDDHHVLAQVAIDGDARWDEFAVHGASIKLEGEDAELKVSDTPTGVFRFESEHDTFIQVTFADGIAARPSDADDHRGHGNHRLVLQGDGFQALLFTEVGYRLDNGTLEVPGELRLVVTDAPGLAAKDDATVEGIADGRIAVEIHVPKDGEVRGAQHGDVNVTIQNEAGSLVAIVEGHGEGKTVLFNLEPGSYTGLDDLDVLFDGGPIGLADSLQDVMHVSEEEASGSVAEYLILVGAQETQILVQVPHFSVHTIELSGASVGASGSGLSAVALIVGGSAAALFVVATLVGRGRAR